MNGDDRGRPPWSMSRCLCGAAIALVLVSAGCGGDGVELGLPENERDAVVAWGEPGDEDPAGVAILLPGGGWQRPSEAAFQGYKRLAETMHSGGFATATVLYGPGAQAVRQIEDVYSEARRRYPNLPICLIGGSAGGHLALLVAAHEPDVACVVDSAGPTDLTSLVRQGSEGIHYAVTAFGRDRFAKFSPVRYADQIKAPVLMIYAESDPLVPVQQGAELARVLPSAELIKLPDGDAPWIHSNVSQEALLDAQARQVAFLEEAIAN